eukprot:CAMPEP_0197632136 /NCGR_PEP_ID=MMETSP1338-20131121/9031_1 /TAXON_ID=43686 ORGANISM="Pelagodinium beii, Strain RCC1491" /NCGR_SAMPLE_ID=MMETSP1338 /ASSEMBLY_ACC=CAM_ASM_000754 /LENGTH=299 /DNA_ID=CAMNT_0043203687 /DNA_START=49 /DNA_END=948 /DNA_ORIENTATION=+
MVLFCSALLPLASRPGHSLTACAGLVAAEEGVSAAKELEDKFMQLKELIGDRSADPQLQEQIKKMEEQLKELKAGQESLDQAKLELAGRTPIASAWTSSCFAMALETLGGTLNANEHAALELLAKKELSRAEAAQMPLFRMVAACLPKAEDEGEDGKLAAELLEQVKDNIIEARKTAPKPPPGLPPPMQKSLQSKHIAAPLMPEAWVAEAEGEDGAEKVRTLTERMWELMQIQAEHATKKTHWTERGPPKIFLLAAIVPGYQIISYYRKKWKEKAREAEVKQAEKAKSKSDKKEKKKDK